jgi:hypothetical protein
MQDVNNFSAVKIALASAGSHPPMVAGRVKKQAHVVGAR